MTHDFDRQKNYIHDHDPSCRLEYIVQHNTLS